MSALTMKPFIVLLCIVVTIGYCYDVDFKGNVSLHNKDEFKYRRVTYTPWNKSPLSNGVAFSSVSLHKNDDTEDHDVVEAVSYHLTGMAPTEFVAYFTKKSVVKIPDEYYQWNVSNASTFIADQLYSIEEIDGDSNVLQTMKLGEIIWTPSTQVSNKKGLYYATYVGTSTTPSTLSLSLTYIMSNRLGRIDYHDAIVTPKSVERILIIEGFPYKDKDEGRLRLNVMVASQHDDAKESDNYKYIDSGSDEQRAYFQVRKKGIVEDDDKGVKLSDWNKDNNYSSLENKELTKQLQELFGKKAKVSKISVTFPKNAKSMKYDTVIGSGEPPSLKTGSGKMPKGWIFTLVIVGIVVGVLAIALIGMFAYRQKRRRQYERI